jgi:membrane dipeptidase
MSKRTFAAVAAILSLGLSPASAADEGLDARVRKILATSPVIDGHNDLPWEIRDRFNGDFNKVDVSTDVSGLPHAKDLPPLMTDIPRLRKGGVGAQFWSVWVPSDTSGPIAVQNTIEQIDIVTRMTARYPDSFAMAKTAGDIRRIQASGKIASLIGIEGGHQINNQLSVLRQMYDLGARYMTLTHSRNTDWADSATQDPKHNGLTPFGKTVVREMNRMGMMVDISHVSPKTMADVLDVSQSPVMFSHSNARSVAEHPRNVPDDVLARMPKNGGIVMVNFYSGYISNAYNQWDAERSAEQARIATPPFSGLYLGQPERAKTALAAWDKAHPRPLVTVADVADHFDHIRKIAGINHVGIGSDFDGVDSVPVGLDSADDYPALLAELLGRGWSDADVAKVTGGNLLRVMEANEKIAASLQQRETPSNAKIEAIDAKTK